MPFRTKLYPIHAKLLGFSYNSNDKVYFRILENYLQFSKTFWTPFYANYN